MKYIIILMVAYIIFYLYNFPGGPKGFCKATKVYYGGVK